MSRIIILNDIATWNRIGMSRYAGPYVVATNLRAAGYDVRVIEWFTQHEDPLELIRAFLTPDTIGVCLSTTFLIPDPYAEPDRKEADSVRSVYLQPALWFQTGEECQDWLARLNREIEEVAPGAPIILGGTKVEHIYNLQEDKIASIYKDVDFALIGAAEDTVVDLFADLQKGRRPFGTTRGGICFIKPTFVRNRCPAIRFYLRDLIQPGEALPIEIKRGCSFNCKFCHYEKRGSTLKDPSVLRDELIRNHELFGTTLYTFTDDCFNDTRKNVESVCDVLAKLPFRVEWVTYARVDLAIKFPETMTAMVETGCRGVFWGIETFNYEAGRAAGKGVHPDRVKQFLLDQYRLYGSRMLIECSFISGLPHETDDTMAETIEWLDHHRPMHSFRMAPLGLFEYHEDMDESVIDYADYARNPEKYGFEEVRHKPDMYWRHATMDLPRATEWAKEAMDMWYAPHVRKPMFRSMWWYPSYRMLGLSHEEIIAGLTEMDGWKRNTDVRERWKTFSKSYWDQLVNT